jgi:hypothetical protein
LRAFVISGLRLLSIGAPSPNLSSGKRGLMVGSCRLSLRLIRAGLIYVMAS